MEKNIYLIDGHALIFKMYYAFLRRPMINSKGVDTSILFGFTKYILEMIERERPTRIAVAFDPPGGTFRNEIYPEYKATRDETPQLVIDSLEPLTEICKALKIPVLMIPGYEADDVIGSAAKKCEKEGFTVYMVTPDKDYGQLISDHIIQYKPGKSGGERELIDKKAICEKYGIERPEQVIDMLTICGDASDNVPGVKGVGEVGAGKLIAKYGSVENIYSHLDELTPKQQSAFEDAESHIGLSHRLVTIKTDIDVDLNPEEAEITSDYAPETFDLFCKYEFNSLLKFVSHIAPKEAQQKKELEIREMQPSEFCKIAAEAGIFSMVADFSGSGVFSVVRRLTAGAVLNGTYYAAAGHCSDFRSIIENPGIKKCGYDLKAQVNALANDGISLEGTLMDIELMHYLINPEKSHKVGILAMSYLGFSIEEDTGVPVQKSLFDEEEDIKAGSRSQEAVVNVLLEQKILENLNKTGADKLYCRIEEPLIRVLAEMEKTGVKVDLSQLRKYAAGLRTELDERQKRIREMTGEPELNISSPMQIGNVLFEKLGLDPKAKQAILPHRRRYAVRVAGQTSCHKRNFGIQGRKKAAVFLYRAVPESGKSCHWKNTHHFQPGPHRYGKAEFIEAESPEYPHPDRTRTRDQEGFCPVDAGRGDTLCGLFSDRAADYGPSQPGRSSDRRFQTRARRACHHGCQNFRYQSGRSHCRPPENSQDSQFRHHVRHLCLRACLEAENSESRSKKNHR